MSGPARPGDLAYKPGATTEGRLCTLRIETDVGVTGADVGGNSPAAAQLNLRGAYLVGRDALDRERHWSVPIECSRPPNTLTAVGVRSSSQTASQSTSYVLMGRSASSIGSSQ